MGYKGGRDYNALKKFADGLGPTCGPANLDLCDDDKKKQIDEFKALGASKREEKIKEGEASMGKLEKDFKTFVEDLQKKYQDASDKKIRMLRRSRAVDWVFLKPFMHTRKSLENPSC